MIRATDKDRADIEAFLNTHATTSMFPLANLARHGMNGGHPRACTFYIRRDPHITDVLTVSDEGALFPQCPNGFDDVADIFNGQTVKAILGTASQVAALRKTLGLTHKAQLDTVEPAYKLDLADLIVPQTTLTLHPLEKVPFDTLVQWRAAYNVESLGVPADKAVHNAANDITYYIESASHRSVWDGDTPVAMTGFNAALPDIVQIGGVYTPPDLRSRGYARTAVARHLAQVAKDGVTQAVLFAANPAAERAYRAIGFTPNGQFTIAFYDAPQVIHV